MMRGRGPRLTKSARWMVEWEPYPKREIERKYDTVSDILKKGGKFAVFDVLCVFFGEVKAKEVCERNFVSTRKVDVVPHKRKRSGTASSGGDPVILSPNQRRAKRQQM